MKLACLPTAGWVLSALLTAAACATAPTPRTAQDFNDRGAAYAQRGQLERAMADFEHAIELDPQNAMAYNNRAYARMQMGGDLEQSIADYTRAIEIHPRSEAAYYSRAVTQFLRGEHERSWEDLRKAQDLGAEVDPAFVEDLREASESER